MKKAKRSRPITASEMGKRRMAKLTPQERSELGRKAVTTRWDRVRAARDDAA